MMMLVASSGMAVDLCLGLVQDKLAHPMTPLAKPGYLQTAVDPEFGTVIRRITDVAPSGTDPAIVPMYSTMPAWNADESVLLLYRRGQGHELYDGKTYQFLRRTPFRPNNLESVYWHTSDPDQLIYTGGKSLWRYRPSTDQSTLVRQFAFCASNIKTNTHAFSSWDSNVVSLKCDSTAFQYRIDTDTLLGQTTTSISDPPLMGADGLLSYWAGDVVDNQFNVVRTLDVGSRITHASLGLLRSGRPTYFSVQHSRGPLGSPVAALIAFDLTDGSYRVLVGPTSGYPYPPSAIHPSAVAYREPGWVVESIVGCINNGSCGAAGSGRDLLDNEVLVVNTNPGEEVVCRVAHHRSWGKANTSFSTPYWAEPHAVPSPSGTRILFASDWGNGPTVDSYVIELPSYGAPPRPNQAPIAGAGPDQTVFLPQAAALDGTVSDDGQPAAIPTTTWSQVSGPGTVLFADAARTDTTATFPAPGTYVLRLDAYDGALGASDEVTVTAIFVGRGEGDDPPRPRLPRGHGFEGRPVSRARSR